MKDIFLRAAKTFLQAFLPVAISNLAGLGQSIGAVKSLLLSTFISAAAAGLSAVWNMISKAEGSQNEE